MRSSRRKSIGRAASGGAAFQSGSPAVARLESLEPRQLLASVFAVADNNVLLEFDSAAPQTILRALPITGLRDGEVMSTIDFDTATERLFGVPSGTRTPVYAIDRLTGAATRIGPGVPFGFPLDRATGLAFNERDGYFRYIDESFGNYRLDPVTGGLLNNDAGQEGLADVAYRPLDGNLDNFAFFGVNHLTNQFMRLDHERMFVLGGGPLGVDIERFVGLDIAPDGTALLSVRVAGVTMFGTIAADGHTFVPTGTIGDGTQYIVRGLAAEPLRRAPVLDGTLHPSLDAIDQDAPDNSGTLIRDLISSTAPQALITDGSPGALQGIAVTSVDPLVGDWQYTLDGSTWFSLASVSESQSIVLPASATARIRLRPLAGFVGIINQAVRFRAWDQLAGTPGQPFNTFGGDDPSVSSDSVWALIAVQPVHHAPTLTLPPPPGGGGAFLLDDKQTVSPLAGAIVGYIDDAAHPLFITVTISNPAHGAFTSESLAASGFALVDVATGTYSFVGNATAATAALGVLVFRPAQNIAPVGQQTVSLFTVLVDDGLGLAAQRLSPFIAVSSARDAPVLSIDAAAIALTDKQTTRPFETITLADADIGKPLTVDIESGPSGTFTADTLTAGGFALVPGTSTWRLTGEAAAITAALRQLVFKPRESLARAGLTTSLTLKVAVTDNLGAPVEVFSPALVVLSVNDRPTIGRLTVANTIRFGATARAFRSLVVGDVDPSDRIRVEVRIDRPSKGSVTSATLRASGFRRIGNGRYRYIGTAAAATTAVRKLRFAWSPTLDTGIAQQVRLKLIVSDAAGAQLVNNQTWVKLRR